MKIVKTINDFWTLKENCWGGALETLKTIEDARKTNKFMRLLEEEFSGCDTPTAKDVNDFIWFDQDFIYESLGLDENGKLQKEE